MTPRLAALFLLVAGVWALWITAILTGGSRG